jgi:hypothetical protein
MLDRTLLVLVSDHGMARIAQTGHVSISDLLVREYGMRATAERCDKEDYASRYAFYSKYDEVVVHDAGRLVGIHLRAAGKEWWNRQPDVRQMELSIRGGRMTAKRLAENLAHRPFARVVAVRAGAGKVLLVGRQGKATVERLGAAPATQPVVDIVADTPGTRYAYRVYEGADPLGMKGVPGTALTGSGPDRGVVMTAEEWLAASADTPNPGVLSQIVPYMASPRVGDIVIFADPGYGFGDEPRGGHGSTTPTEMFVPFVWAGPDVEPGTVTTPVSTHDLMPTVVSYLGFGDRLRSIPPVDGEVLPLGEKLASSTHPVRSISTQAAKTPVEASGFQ